MSTDARPSRLLNHQPAAGRRPRGPRLLVVLGGAAVGALTLLVQPVGAQSSGKGFLFSPPVGSFSLRGGYALASAGSGVFDDATSQLTLSKSDFGSIAWGGDISYSPSTRFDLVFDGGISSSTKDSEVRDFVEDLPNGGSAPIRQTTRYRRVPLTVGIKYYLADRGRSIGQFAYIPSKYAPYVGIGAGAMWYKFKQNGDFVDFASDPQFPEIFTAELESSGWTPMAHGAAGIDYSIGPWLALTGEARYQWARARLDPITFEGYDKIDLSGVTGTVGFRVRF
jgi:hypothetical protein